MMRADAYKAALCRLPLRPLETILAPGGLLVLAPHPDDKSLGCGGLIAEAVAKGRAVHVAILTDGRASHPGSREFPPPRLADLRAVEARGALAALGLPPDRLTWLGEPDGQAPTNGAAFDALAGRLAELVARHDIATLCASAASDPHCDHEAAAMLAGEVARRTGVRHLAYPVWTWALPDGHQLPGPPAGARLDIARHLPAKRAAIAAHASQTGVLIADAPDGFRLAPEFVALFTRPWECFLTP